LDLECWLSLQHAAGDSGCSGCRYFRIGGGPIGTAMHVLYAGSAIAIAVKARLAA
jgi:hypothetical protein